MKNNSETMPTFWQDPDRPELWVEHSWLYSTKENKATTDYRYVYNVPGIVKRKKFIPFDADVQSHLKSIYNAEWNQDV